MRKFLVLIVIALMAFNLRKMVSGTINKNDS